MIITVHEIQSIFLNKIAKTNQGADAEIRSNEKSSISGVIFKVHVQNTMYGNGHTANELLQSKANFEQ